MCVHIHSVYTYFRAVGCLSTQVEIIKPEINLNRQAILYKDHSSVCVWVHSQADKGQCFMPFLLNLFCCSSVIHKYVSRMYSAHLVHFGPETPHSSYTQHCSLVFIQGLLILNMLHESDTVHPQVPSNTPTKFEVGQTHSTYAGRGHFGETAKQGHSLVSWRFAFMNFKIIKPLRKATVVLTITGSV